jgi:hypothetical protein
MTTKNEFSLACTEMGSHEASLIYNGSLCHEGALALEYQCERLFGYYKYERITLSIESPGGVIDGLEYVLRTMTKWAGEGRVVAVRSTFQCASAAAFLLAMGEWGKRRVDRATFLLFHSARIDSSAIGGMTAAYSTNLSQALSSVDRKLLEVLLGQMLKQTGSAQGLSNLIASRIRYLDKNWKQITNSLSTLTSGHSLSKTDWLKALQKWTRVGTDPNKLVVEMKKHLQSRLQHEARMDLREAYALCLIDEIDGVLDAGSALRDSQRPVPVDSSESVPASLFVAEPAPVNKTKRRPDEQDSAGEDHMQPTRNMQRDFDDHAKTR